MQGFPILILGLIRCRCGWALGNSSETAEPQKSTPQKNTKEKPLNRRIAASLVFALFTLLAGAQEPAGWIAASNKYTNQLLAVEMKHSPELGSNQGLSQFDAEVSQPTLADEDQERKEKEGVLSTLKSALGQEKQKEVAQDLQIVIRNIDLQFREQDFDR